MHRLYFVLFLTIFSSYCVAAEHRLPDGIKLLNQKVFLDLDPNSPEYSGTTEIAIRVSDSDRVAFHAKSLNIQSVSLTQSSNKRAIDTVTANEYDIVFIDLYETLKSELLLEIQFSGKIGTQVQGLFSQNTDTDSAYLFTQFQEMMARDVFPTLDEPNQKATFQFTVTVPEQYEAIHNSGVKSLTKDNKKKIIEFEKTPRINTDVLALGVGEFSTVSLENTQLNTKVYFPKSENVELPSYMGLLVDETVERISEYLNSPFPYEKLDFFFAPISTFAAMENVGLVSINSNLLPGPESDGYDVCNFRKLVAHEIAHMWFGNHITMNWYNDFWMNESFAEFIAAKVIKSLYPGESSCAENPQLRAFFDDMPSNRPLRAPVKTRHDSSGIGQLAYTKGYAILKMLEQSIGELEFQIGLQKYVKSTGGGFTSLDVFASHFSQYPHFRPSLVSFLEQSSYPLVILTLQNNELYLVQRPFFPEQDATWTIPLLLTYQDGEETNTVDYILGDKPLHVKEKGPNNSYFIDTGGFGYFRYLDETRNVPFPLEDLTNSELNSYMENQSALAKSGLINYMDYIDSQIELINKFPKDSPLVSGALSNLQDAYIELLPNRLHEPYSMYLSENLVQDVDWDEIMKLSTGSDWLELYGIYLKQPEAISFAKASFNEKLLKNLVHRKAILRVIVSNASMDEYKEIKRSFSKSELNTKNDLLDALGYGKNTEQVLAFYEFLLSEKTNNLIIDYRFQYPSFSPKHRETVSRFFSRNKARLRQKIADERLQWMPYTFITSCSKNEVGLVKKAFSTWNDIKGLEDKLMLVIDKINQCERDSADILQSIDSRLKH